MKLLTKVLEAKIPRLYATENKSDAEKVCHVKWFDPCGRGTWYVIEYDPGDRIAFCWCVSPLGEDCDELGYVSLDELQSVRNRMGLGIERDQWWTPTTLDKIRKGKE